MAPRKPREKIIAKKSKPNNISNPAPLKIPELSKEQNELGYELVPPFHPTLRPR
jgi:hypothetical protein